MAGIFAYHYAAPQADPAELRALRDRMSRRGPDGLGEWRSADGRAALGHRRLSIIDLSERGAQPMALDGGRLVVSFNGEIYNYKELRRALEAKGRRFASDSDTEVLLHLYDEKGSAMLGDLRGMFAFALWDSRAKTMLLARDPYGIKPLYYADDGWTLRVASHAKALAACDKVSKLPEPAGLAGYFLTGSVPEPFTLFQEIRQVPAGSYVTVDAAGPSSPVRYFSVGDVWREAENAGGRGAELRDALLDSVRHHFVSDVPVALFLSSGIDSAALAGLAADAGFGGATAITLGFEEFRGGPEDELPLARKTAAYYGLRHEVRVLTQSEGRAAMGDFFASMDQPTIDGFNTYLVSRAAAGLGFKVALSGLGADELFGGYPSFRDLPRWTSALAAPSRVPLAPDVFFAASAPFARGNPKLRGMLRYGRDWAGAYLLKRGLFMPWELPDLLGEEAAREGMRRLECLERFRAAAAGPRSDFAKVSSLESSLYMRNQLLRDADWAGMAHSLEIRTPYVDAFLLRAAAPRLLREALPGKTALARTPSLPLPEELVKRAKTGFRVPIGEWMASDESLDSWKRVPLLRREGHWSRRWAYAVCERLKEAA